MLSGAASGPAAAQITHSGKAYEFRAKFVKGEILRYEITSAATPTGAKAAMKMTRPLVMTVQDAKNGTASVKIVSGPTMLNGQRLGDAQTATVQINDRGKTLGMESPGMLGAGQFLPTKPLAIGDSFQTTSRVALPGLDTSVTAVSKLVGFKVIRGHRAACFYLRIVGTGSIAITGRGTSYFDVADGQLLTMNSSQDITIKQGGTALKIRNVATVDRK